MLVNRLPGQYDVSKPPYTAFIHDLILDVLAAQLTELLVLRGHCDDRHCDNSWNIKRSLRKLSARFLLPSVVVGHIVHASSHEA